MLYPLAYVMVLTLQICNSNITDLLTHYLGSTKTIKSETRKVATYHEMQG